MDHILCLDIDGVLHPANCRVLLDFSSPDWMLATQARTQGLFRWGPLFAEGLKGTEVRLLIHSTWRRRCGDRTLRNLLEPDLAHRVIMTDFWVSQDDRVNLSHSAYIEQVLVAGRENGHWGDAESLSVLIIDDRPELFTEDFSRLGLYRPTLIAPDPGLGVSDARVMSQVTQWAGAGNPWARSDARGPCESMDPGCAMYTPAQG